MRFKKYCIAFGCLNSNRDRSLSFFTLPKQAERCQKWLKLIHREDLMQKPDLKTGSYVVCSAHFEDSSIKPIKLLTTNAIPTKLLPQTNYIETESTPESKVDVILSDDDVSGEQSPSEEIKDDNKKYFNVNTQTKPLPAKDKQTQTSEKLTGNTSRKRKLSKELREAKLKRRKLDKEIKKMEMEIEAKNKFATWCDPEDEIGVRFQKIIDLQNKLKTKYRGNRYDAEYKLFALYLHYSSPHAYRCLTTVLKLPNKSTLNRLKVNISPKLDQRVLDSLALKIKSLPDSAKYCTICVDEITLKRNLYYDTKIDEIIGFHNVNGNISKEIASNAFVIMLQGIYFKWNQAIAYALLATAEYYEEVELWLNEVISKLSMIGIKVKAIISHQGSHFEKFAKEVKKVTIEKPYSMFDDETKIYYIFDVPNLIKCIRDNLLTSDYVVDEKKISWRHIKDLYEDQKQRGLRLIPKITDAHVQPTTCQRMSLELAVQTLSRTVSAALHTYVDLGKMSQTARPTANFLKLMNDLFDVLNSSKINSPNKLQTAFRHDKEQKHVIDTAKQLFSIIKAVNQSTQKNNTEHMKPFENFQITINSIQMLFEDLQKDGCKYLLTRRLNQDNLENFFVGIRQQGDSCTGPTPVQFKRSFSKLFLSNMLKSSPDKNCEMDIGEILLKAEEIMSTLVLDTDRQPQTSAVGLQGETDYRMDLPEENTLTYVSAYLFFKCINQHACPDIVEVVKSVPDLGETNLFTRFKAYNKTSGFYGSLKMPPKEFIQYIQNLETAFTQNYEKLLQNNPGKELLKLTQTISPQTPCPCFPVNYLLKLFIRFRIFATIKFNNRRLKSGKQGIIKVSHL